MSVKLYTNKPDNYFYFVAKIAADYNHVPVEVVIVDETMAADKDFKAKKSHGRFPFVELADGTLIKESSAIAAYFARVAGNTSFLGETAFQAAQVSQWTAIADSNLWVASRTIAYNTFGFENNQEKYNEAVKNTKASLKMMNDFLANNDWLVSNTFTLADLSVFVALIVPFSYALDGGFRKAMPHVTAYFQKIASLPVVTRTTGYTKIAEKIVKPTFGKNTPAPAPAPAPKKEEPKKEAPKKVEDDDEMDLFGSSDEDEAPKKELSAAAKAKMAAVKKKEQTLIQKSIVLWEVKPWGEETNLDELAKMILAIEMPGLFWKTEYKKEPIAYGVEKLIIGATVEDAKCSTEDVADAIEAFEDHVQSIDVLSFNKI